MSFRSVAIAVVIAVVVLLTVDLFILNNVEEPMRRTLHACMRLLAWGGAAVFAGLTAARFNWMSEYVGRPWTFLFLMYTLLAIGDGLGRLANADANVTAPLVIVANISAVAAFWLFGRALHQAGLQFYGPAWIRVAVFLGAIVVAVALVFPTILLVLRSNASRVVATSDIISATADMLTFVLIAPVLLTVWSFRGGHLSWVYGYLAISTIGWIVNQAADDVMPAALVRNTQLFGFFLACVAVAAAAYTHRASTRRGAVHA